MANYFSVRAQALVQLCPERLKKKDIGFNLQMRISVKVGFCEIFGTLGTRHTNLKSQLCLIPCLKAFLSTQISHCVIGEHLVIQYSE